MHLSLPWGWSPGTTTSTPESQTPWRPCILTPQVADPTRIGSQLEAGYDQQTFGSKGAFGFQHPVRLYLPISKHQQYLQSSGEKVLASFPVQATIHFYNNESNSDEQEEGTQPSHLQCQEAQDGPGGKGRDRLTNPGWQPGGCSGLSGKGSLHHPDSPEDAGYPSSK